MVERFRPLGATGDGVGAHMQLDHTLHVGGQLPFGGQAANEGTGDRDPFVFVTESTPAPVDQLGGGGFAEIVGKRGQHERQRPACLIAQLGGLVDHAHGVLPHVAFWVVLRRLLDADQGRDLGKPRLKLIHLTYAPEEHGRTRGLEQGFFKLAHHALLRERSQIHFPAQRNGLGRHGELEARRELRRAQDTQGILDKARLAHVPQNARPKIGHAVEMIDYLAG